jgi:type IV secretory pathway TraG/TraD family ATPase VirD4
MVGSARPRGDRVAGIDADHWSERAEALLAPLLHAASMCDADMRDVSRWVNRAHLDTALTTLAAHGAHIAEDVLAGIQRTDWREQSGIWSTASGVLSAYRSAEALSASLNPNVDPLALPGCSDTIYICSTGRHQRLVAPIVVAFIEQVRAGAYAAALDSESYGRPVLLALDEVANIAPLPELPAIVSEGGSQGLRTLACLQDLSQARTRWGGAAEGFLSLFGAKVALGGIGDLKTLELLSALAGETEAPVKSVSFTPWWTGRRGGLNETRATRPLRRLAVDAVAQLPQGTAIVVEGANPPRSLRLTPWYATAPFSAARSVSSRSLVRERCTSPEVT